MSIHKHALLFLSEKKDKTQLAGNEGPCPRQRTDVGNVAEPMGSPGNLVHIDRCINQRRVVSGADRARSLIG